ncbi:MAG: hypothetical protein ACI3XR_05875 [Eubacteriales bacterium]
MSKSFNKMAFKLPKSARQSRKRFIQHILIAIAGTFFGTALIIWIAVAMTPTYVESELPSVHGEVVAIERTRQYLGRGRATHYTFTLENQNRYRVNGSMYAGMDEITEGEVITVVYVPSETYKGVFPICALSSADTVYFTLYDYNHDQLCARILIILIVAVCYNILLWMYTLLKYYPHEYAAVKERFKKKE